MIVMCVLVKILVVGTVNYICGRKIKVNYNLNKIHHIFITLLGNFFFFIIIVIIILLIYVILFYVTMSTCCYTLYLWLFFFMKAYMYHVCLIYKRKNTKFGGIKQKNKTSPQTSKKLYLHILFYIYLEAKCVFFKVGYNILFFFSSIK